MLLNTEMTGQPRAAIRARGKLAITILKLEVMR